MTLVQHIKVADQVWIAAALLLRENSHRPWVTKAEIEERVRREFGHVLPGIPVHISTHCVANKKPNPGRYRMLVSGQRGAYRLFRSGDDQYHPDREGGKIAPHPEEIPPKYHLLLKWYEQEYCIKAFGPDDHLLDLAAGASGRSDVSERHDQYLGMAHG